MKYDSELSDLLAGHGISIMSVTLETRKPAQALSLADLIAFPIWEFASDEEGVNGQDESWVRPTTAETVLRRSYVLASAVFEDRRGRNFDGYVIVSTLEDSIEICSGAIIKGGGAILIPNPEVVTYRQARATLRDGLGLMDAELSALAFTLKVPVIGMAAPFTGELRLPSPVDPSERQLSLW